MAALSFDKMGGIGQDFGMGRKLWKNFISGRPANQRGCWRREATTTLGWILDPQQMGLWKSAPF